MTDISESPFSAYGPMQVRRFLSQRVRVDGAGRVVVPAAMRKALGIRSGQNLAISLDGDCIRLQTIDAALERVRAIARRKRKSALSVVDEFIAERRKEAAEE